MTNTVEYKGYSIKISQEDDAENPLREFDMLGTFSCFHRRYDLSSKEAITDIDELKSYIKSGKAVFLPLYLYDHSGITISTSPFSCPWDSGQVGFIHVDKAKVREEYSCKRISKKILQRVYEVLKGEVATFDDYITGNVYSYTIENNEGEVIDSCGGYFGNPEESSLLADARSAIDYIISSVKAA
ncbi:hypothetical protein PV783_33905 [Chitinophaga sp. CC14]|uniref:hypothetical protein n=1 Tax=Chitinophaga sp. CC14 TaxID=3029199 RepID=UPI003B7DB291